MLGQGSVEAFKLKDYRNTIYKNNDLFFGIAPWGLLRKADNLIGKNAYVVYERHFFTASDSRRRAILNDRHSYFLLADDGTADRFYKITLFCPQINLRYGADIVLRKVI